MITTTPDTHFDLDQFFDVSFDLICVAGFDGYFKKVNLAVLNTLGYTKEELFSRPIDSFVHEDDRRLTAGKREAIKKGKPLLNFENRYITKSGEIVWLFWTSVPVESQEAVFAIAKDITYRKKLEEYQRISGVLENRLGVPENRVPAASILAHSQESPFLLNSAVEDRAFALSAADSRWLSEVETYVKKNMGKIDLNIHMLSDEMAISERHLNRRIKTITGITPNKYIRIIRLHMAKEAIDSGRYRTVTEIANLAGFETPAYFNKLFKEVYGSDAGELLRSKRFI